MFLTSATTPPTALPSLSMLPASRILRQKTRRSARRNVRKKRRSVTHALIDLDALSLPAHSQPPHVSTADVLIPEEELNLGERRGAKRQSILSNSPLGLEVVYTHKVGCNIASVDLIWRRRRCKPSLRGGEKRRERTHDLELDPLIPPKRERLESAVDDRHLQVAESESSVRRDPSPGAR